MPISQTLSHAIIASESYRSSRASAKTSWVGVIITPSEIKRLSSVKEEMRCSPILIIDSGNVLSVLVADVSTLFDLKSKLQGRRMSSFEFIIGRRLESNSHTLQCYLVIKNAAGPMLLLWDTHMMT